MNETNKIQYFWDICGQEKVVDFLKSAIKNNRVGHAYIFTGPDALGKETIANQFIKSLMCTGTGETKPCNDCAVCRQINNRTHPDVFRLGRIQDEKTGKWKRDIIIDQIRELKYKLSQGSFLSGWKAAIISEAELLNINSANAFLKVLEEPTAKTIIILIVSDISAVPKTIASRCQVLSFLPVARKEIKDYLLSNEVAEEIAERSARLALGRPGRAVALANNQELLNEEQEQIDSLLKILPLPLVGRLKLLDEVFKADKDEAISSDRAHRLMESWQITLRDLILLKLNSEYYMSNLSSLPLLYEIRDKVSWERVLNADRLISELKKMFNNNISSKNILENLVINL
ncbi:MAG: DNA polymerase III subunit delta' [Patescibacteria group bacterium]|jgi:DNA polymerase-3 subunit delta'